MSFDKIEQKIGYSFADKSLLKRAFTHKSFSADNNERMEYLGDAVLELIVTENQYLSGVKAEGEMSNERQKLVSKPALLEIANELGLKEYLLFIGGEQNVGAKTVSSLFESLVAAIYLDGGYEKAKGFVLPFLPRLKIEQRQNYINPLQEYLQKRGEGLPEYIAKQKGPDNSPEFLVKAKACGLEGEGVGKTKGEAKQAAAKALLEKLSGETKK